GAPLRPPFPTRRSSDLPVGDPEPATPLDELVLEEGKPLTFSVDVEVVPDFELPSLDGIEIKRPILEILDEHIESEVQRQCINLRSEEHTSELQSRENLV